MKLIDSHCHLYNYEQDLDNFIQKSITNNIKSLMIIFDIVDYGEKFTTYLLYVNTIRQKYINQIKIFISLGCHPLSVHKISLDKLDSLMNLYGPQVDCIGEIGLDHYKSNDQMQKIQIDHFKKQCEIAIKYNKPINIHARDCPMDLIIDITKNNNKKILHCCTFKWKHVEKFINQGGFVSLSGIVTFKKNADYLTEVAKNLPIHRLLVETDSPYLSPEPKRGSVNEPANVLYTYKKISSIRNENLETLTDTIYNNFISLMTNKTGQKI